MRNAREHKYYRLINDLVDFITGLIVISLIVRIILRLIDANPNSDFTRFVYDSTEPLLYPFKDLFPVIGTNTDSVLDFTSIMAILTYVVLGYLLTELVKNIHRKYDHDRNNKTNS